MVQRLNQGQIKSLEVLLQLNGGKELWQTSAPSNEISKQIYDWMADWTTGIRVSRFSDAFGKPRAEKHRDLNDKLVEHGFLDLAREIMIIEQQQQLDRLKSSQAVPDDLVYTEVKKTLVRGVRGVLTCRFYGIPLAVFWGKGLDPDDLSLMVVLYDGEVSGPRYDDGSCDVDENYSLIIKNVSTADVGRIYCTVFSYKGILIDNYTDISITDSTLATDPQVTMQMRQAIYGILQCTVHIKVRKVSWKRRTISSANESLVILENSEDAVKRSGTGFEEGMYNITQDYSLVIKEVQIHHEGLYICEVTDFDTGISFRNHSFVNVVGNYSSVPRSAPDQELEAKKMQSLVRRVDKVSMKHYRRIYDAMETKYFQAEKIIAENTTALFNTHQMIVDWQQRLTSTNSQYRKVVRAAFIVADKSVPFSDHAWPSNDELKSISLHLTQESMEKICKKLKIVCISDDANDEEKRFDTLQKWRNKVAEKSLQETHEQLSSALGSINFKGLLPFLKGQFIYKAELVDMAFHMLSQDLLPIAEALGIHFTKLNTYRPAFEPSHLQIGTIALLSKLLTKIKVDMFSGDEKRETRPVFCTRMSKLQYRNVATLGMYVYEMSYGELFRIAEAMKQNTGEETAVTDIQSGALQSDEAAGTSKIGTREEESCLGAPSTLPQGEDRDEPDIEKAESVPGQLGEPKDKELINLLRVLQLTDEDLTDALGTSHPITTYTLFKLLKEKPRQSVFNYRAALAYELRKMKEPGLADEVIAGKYITRQTSLEFIENMVQGLNQDEIRSLGELLQLSRKEEQWHTTTPFNKIIKQIYDWVADWTSGRKDSLPSSALALVNLRTEATAKKHRDLNDKLVEHGFLDLAREIMIIERQLAKL
eukprot:XP_011682511.1 PREDICTED: uncharacterized protein LOC105446858 [Strongylocentrotus purpuratus]